VCSKCEGKLVFATHAATHLEVVEKYFFKKKNKRAEILIFLLPLSSTKQPLRAVRKTKTLVANPKQNYK
jgi:hypothetical protein